MKYLAMVGAALATVMLTAGSCDDPHKNEHCVSYAYHHHTHTTGSKNHRHTTSYTSHDCIQWEKNS